MLALPGFARTGELLIHNHPSGLLEPSNADLEIAAKMHDDGIGFAIIDNDASRIYVVVEIPRTRERKPKNVKSPMIEFSMTAWWAMET